MGFGVFCRLGLRTYDGRDEPAVPQTALTQVGGVHPVGEQLGVFVVLCPRELKRPHPRVVLALRILVVHRRGGSRKLRIRVPHVPAFAKARVHTLENVTEAAEPVQTYTRPAVYAEGLEDEVHRDQEELKADEGAHGHIVRDELEGSELL
jgi:hypothetical protein